jgi:hypothetical protein
MVLGVSAVAAGTGPVALAVLVGWPVPMGWPVREGSVDAEGVEGIDAVGAPAVALYHLAQATPPGSVTGAARTLPGEGDRDCPRRQWRRIML